MLKSKRFWGAVLALGTAGAAHFGVVPDAATQTAITTVVATATPVYMLVTKIIDLAKGK